jgi:hypothetical protein
MDQTGSATTETSVDEDQARITATGKVLVDYKQFDYRGFVFCLHDDYGLMLLHCTRKKRYVNSVFCIQTTMFDLTIVLIRLFAVKARGRIGK